MNKAITKKISAVLAMILVLSFVLVGFAAIGTASAETTSNAAATTTDAATSTATSSSSGTIQFVVSIVLLIVIFYFFLIRPEKKRKKEDEELRSSLAVGDDVVTIGGICGKIVDISGDKITFETGEDRVRIQVAKYAISRKAKETK